MLGCLAGRNEAAEMLFRVFVLRHLDAFRVTRRRRRSLDHLARPLSGLGEKAGINSVSGMLRQYFFGISARIASRFARAGLKVAR